MPIRNNASGQIIKHAGGILMECCERPCPCENTNRFTIGTAMNYSVCPIYCRTQGQFVYKVEGECRWTNENGTTLTYDSATDAWILTVYTNTGTLCGVWRSPRDPNYPICNVMTLFSKVSGPCLEGIWVYP